MISMKRACSIFFSGEIGIYTRQRLVTVPFDWHSLAVDQWHSLRAVGGNGTTRFFCNGWAIGMVHEQPKGWPERHGLGPFRA